MTRAADLELISRVLVGAPGPSAQARGQARTALLSAIDAESRAARPRPRRLRIIGPRRLALVCGAVLLGGTGATAATIVALENFTHDTPVQLFRDNPDRIGNPWVKQSLVAGTVRQVETITVPGVGRAQFWTAAATHHGICVALRLPGGVWAGSPNRFEFSGPVPGCVYKFSSDPRAGWSPKRGFFWLEYQTGGHWLGRVVLGTVPSVGRPVAVRDALSGTTARVVDRRYFAILIPPSHGQWKVWMQEGGGRVEQLRYRLETLDASGHVLARAPEMIEP